MRVTMMGLYGVEDCIKEWCEKVCVSVREEEVWRRRGGERGEEWGRVVEAWFMQAEKCCPSDARVEVGGWARVCA